MMPLTPFANALNLAIERDVRGISRLNRDLYVGPGRCRRRDGLWCAMCSSIYGVGRAQRDHRDRQKRPDRAHEMRRFSALSLPRLATTSNDTLAPSARLVKSAFSTAEIWTKTSLPPPSGWMKP
jgi:hypothetical protein